MKDTAFGGSYLIVEGYMQVAVLISILLTALIYLHIKRDPLIFQPDIKLAKLLVIITLLSIVALDLLMTLSKLDREFVSFVNAVIWGLIIFSYWKFFAGCYKVACLNKSGSADPLLRAKVCDMLIQVSQRQRMTEEFKMFLQLRHDDPLVEEIRRSCGSVSYYTNPNQPLPEKEWQRLKDFAIILKQQP